MKKKMFIGKNYSLLLKLFVLLMYGTTEAIFTFVLKSPYESKLFTMGIIIKRSLLKLNNDFFSMDWNFV